MNGFVCMVYKNELREIMASNLKMKCKRYIIYVLIFIVIFFVLQFLFERKENIINFSMDIEQQIEDTVQIFYDNELSEPSFDEGHSVKIEVGADDTIQNIKSKLPTQSHKKMRIDLGNISGKNVSVGNICVLLEDKKFEINAENLIEAVNSHNVQIQDLQLLGLNGELVSFLTTGIDPYISFTNNEFSEGKIEKPILIPLLLSFIFTLLLYKFVYLKDVLVFVKDVWRNKKLMMSLSVNDFKIKYAGSYFGITWAFVQPICTIIIFWFVFEFGFRNAAIGDVPYVLWLSSGLIPWFFFSDAWNSATNTFVEYSYLVKKIVFKIDILPPVKIISALFVHLFFIGFLVLIFLFNGILPNFNMLWLIYYAFCMICYILGLSLITSSIIIFFKDLGQIMNIILQFAMWLTPIMWSTTTMNISEKYIWIFKLNPMYYVVEGYRWCMIGDSTSASSMNDTVYFWFFTVVIFLIGLSLFKRLKPHFADVL